MQKAFKIGAAIALAFLLVMMTGCSGGINQKEALDTVQSFLNAIAEGDYVVAQTYLHPERPNELEPYFTALAEELELDYSQGITIQKQTAVSWSLFDTSVGGASYEATLELAVGEVTFSAVAEIVRNQNGYGLYNFTVDP